jgi:high affinity Mn2+ porin
VGIRGAVRLGLVVAVAVTAPIPAAVSACGADIARQLPRNAPANTGFDWTGLYVGGHVGYTRGNAQVTVSEAAPDNFRNSFGGMIGGLQIGYNYVLPSRFLLGVEADASFLNYLSADDLAWFRTTRPTPISPRRSSSWQHCAAG